MPAALAGLALGALVGWYTHRPTTTAQDATGWRPYAHRDMNDLIPGAN